MSCDHVENDIHTYTCPSTRYLGSVLTKGLRVHHTTSSVGGVFRIESDVTSGARLQVLFPRHFQHPPIIQPSLATDQIVRPFPHLNLVGKIAVQYVQNSAHEYIGCILSSKIDLYTGTYISYLVFPTS